MNKKGFTLIELLAVIVILGVILLIAVPQVSFLITKSRRESLKISANGLIDSAIYYYSNNGDKTITSPLETTITNNVQTGDLKLSYDGKIENGKVTLYSDGNIGLCITDGNYYAYKTGYETTVTISDIECSTDNYLVLDEKQQEINDLTVQANKYLNDMKSAKESLLDILVNKLKASTYAISDNVDNLNITTMAEDVSTNIANNVDVSTLYASGLGGNGTLTYTAEETTQALIYMTASNWSSPLYGTFKENGTTIKTITVSASGTWESSVFITTLTKGNIYTYTITGDADKVDGIFKIIKVQ